MTFFLVKSCWLFYINEKYKLLTKQKPINYDAIFFGTNYDAISHTQMFVHLCEIYIECIKVFWIKENWREDIKVEWRNTRLQLCCFGHFLLQEQYHFQKLKLRPNWNSITGLQWKPSRYIQFPFCKLPIYYIIFLMEKSYISNFLVHLYIQFITCFYVIWMIFLKISLDISLNYVTLLV